MNRRERRIAGQQGKPARSAFDDGMIAALYDDACRHMQGGKYLDAQICCRQALAIDGDHADTLHLMGLLCLHIGQGDHALAWLSRAIAQDPKTLYLTTLGTALLQQGRGEEALAAFERAIRLEPGDAELWCNKGCAFSELKRPVEALSSFERALELEPRHLEAASRSALLLHQAGRLEEALVRFELCNALKPGDFQTLHLRADVLQKLSRLEPALADRQAAHALDPGNADACVGLGNALAALGRYEEALPWFDRALGLRQDVAYGFRARGVALQQLGRFDEAMTAYKQATLTDPNEAEAAWNLALLQLLSGDFAAGWAGREAARFRIPALADRYPKLGKPLWRGIEPVDGRIVLVCQDEGLGDVLQYVRYIPMLAARGARVILVVQDELLPLLSGMAGVAQCLSRSAGAALAFDFHCPLTSLPAIFGTRLESIPAETSYLPPPAADRVAAWARRLGPHERLRAGLVWSGNPKHANDRNRSMPFRTMARILDTGATFVSLQKEVKAEDGPALRQRADLIDLTAHLVDFAETAALVSCLDLVITVDTSVAHLAGALGRPTWILLPHAPDYRWLLGREDSPWYPTARLFRCDASRDYSGAVDRVRDELVLLAGTFRSR